MPGKKPKPNPIDMVAYMHDENKKYGGYSQAAVLNTKPNAN